MKSIQIADYFAPFIAFVVALLFLVGLAGLCLIIYKFFTWDRLRYSSDYAVSGPPSRKMLAPIFAIFLAGTGLISWPALGIYFDTFKIKISEAGDWRLVNPYFIPFGKIAATESREVRLGWSELWEYYNGAFIDMSESTDFEITTEGGTVYRFSTLKGSAALKNLGYTEAGGCPFSWDENNRAVFAPHTYGPNGPVCPQKEPLSPVE